MPEMNHVDAIYAFAAWLTQRDKQIVASRRDDASPMAEAVRDFTAVNFPGMEISEDAPGWINPDDAKEADQIDPGQHRELKANDAGTPDLQG